MHVERPVSVSIVAMACSLATHTQGAMVSNSGAVLLTIAPTSPAQRPLARGLWGGTNF